ncbi:ArsR/SmtB family transcription factor [Pseudohoeflea coraliihabitans]|uniref:Metalloregulator ArsR/SmtB family transcription factor n=1 Tax=Pseudohoeflea coraliihabitans TaxID=2860393 RepID=A0ABS6WJ35_9HYPH|nr:metalloregulator ArsR/SmtB family transcription factor [Pseudohoeflea sp. DP4N28-3]MBW3095944.1 metalloregulator ArsR/SmtB family transcription factor [Pseudohoeflea sp. DP4N28-3]
MSLSSADWPDAEQNRGSHPGTLGLEQCVDVLKASGEPTRLRLIALLASGDLTVSEMTEILGQSQPRISRHLKLLGEAGLVERYQEGAWAYFRLVGDGLRAGLIRRILAAMTPDDAVIERDGERLKAIKQARADRAQAYFSANADGWNELRKLHVPEDVVEAEILRILGRNPFNALLDLGTGTGRILNLLSDRYRRGIGVDASRDMLAIARSRLDASGVTHASVRQGDIYNLPLERETFDVVTIHQVLHFLHDPLPAIREAARMLSPGGRLLIIDFAPHSYEDLRSEHAHARLGFAQETVGEWLTQVGLAVEEIVDLPPRPEDAGELTVTLWLARDPRLLIAQPTFLATGTA